jgi:hypothetical protein
MLDKITNIFTRPRGGVSDKFSLTGFTSELHKSGVAKPAYFAVMITPPTKLFLKKKFDPRPLMLRIEAAELPFRGMMTHDQMYYGPARMIPYAMQRAQPITLTVILSEDYREREFFMQWQDLFLGNWRRDDNGHVPYPRMFDTGYYDDGTKGASIELLAYATTPTAQSPTKTPSRSLFDEAQEIARAVGFDPSIVTDPFGLNLFGGAKERAIQESLKVTLHEPYPFDITAVAQNWNEDGYGRLNVTFQYRYFTESHRMASDAAGEQSYARMFRDGINAFNRFRPIFSVVRGQGIGGAARAGAGQVSGGVRNVGRSITTF